MNNTFRMVCFLWVVLFGLSGLQAEEAVVVKMRLYRGVRDSGKMDKDKMDVYALRKIADACILSDQQAGMEKKSIIKIYNLNYAHNLYKLAMLLKRGSMVQTGKGLMLNKRNMNLRIKWLAGKPDLFRVAILPVGKRNEPLLISEIIIPAGKTAVLGFEDSEGSIFFLAINRIKDRGSPNIKTAKTVEFPKLISRSAPPYPPDALAKGISGVVIMECHTDQDGRVNKIHVIEGPKALAEPARADVMKWRYSPWKINGKAEPVRMHLMIFYTIIENSKKSIDTSEKGISETLEKYKPLMCKWQTTYPISAENQAILEVIIAEGRK
jgi:hypothetical protein